MPLKKSGSPKVTCSAPASTCRRMSSRTTSGWTIRKRPPVEFADCGQDLDREARRRVHGHVESDQVRLAHRLLAQGLAREVETRHASAGAPQPRRRRGQPKRLPAELVSRNKNAAGALH